MNSQIKAYKDSLRFNSYDLRLIVAGVFNRDRIFVAKLKDAPNHNLLEIIPLYTILREDGIFVKKNLQNYNNVHSLLVPNNIGQKIIKNFNAMQNTKQHYVLSFIKTRLETKKFYKNHEEFYFSYMLFPGDTIITSGNVGSVYFRPPRNFLSLNMIKITSEYTKQLNCKTIINLDRLYWRSYRLMEATIRDSFNKKPNSQTGMSVLQNKLTIANSRTSDVNSNARSLPRVTVLERKIEVVRPFKQNFKKATQPVTANRSVTNHANELSDSNANRPVFGSSYRYRIVRNENTLPQQVAPLSMRRFERKTHVQHCAYRPWHKFKRTAETAEQSRSGSSRQLAADCTNSGRVNQQLAPRTNPVKRSWQTGRIVPQQNNRSANFQQRNSRS